MPPFGVAIGDCRAQQKRGMPPLAVGRLPLPAGAGAIEDLEHWIEDVRQTLSRLNSKRATLEGQIAAAASSRGRRRAQRRAQAVLATLPPADDDQCCYTGKGAIRRRLRAAAGGVKTERERLEALLCDLQEAVVDARERLALQPAGN